MQLCSNRQQLIPGVTPSVCDCYSCFWVCITYALSYCIISLLSIKVKLQKMLFICSSQIWCWFLLAVSSPGCWTQVNDVHGFRGTPRKFTRLNECQSACINSPTCVAIDWDPRSSSGQTCWILTSTATAPATLPGYITHYELNRACQS